MTNTVTEPCKYCGEIKEEIAEGPWGFIVGCFRCGREKRRKIEDNPKKEKEDKDETLENVS